MEYTHITMNLQGANTRRQTLEGKEYLVVPTVMMTPGVHVGNQGPLLYTDKHMGKNPQVWNYKPVTLFHPEMDGQGVSACDPEIIERQKVGLIMQASYEGKLKNETWIDEAKARGIPEGAQVLDAINKGEMVEVSTGLFYDADPTPGMWNDEPYKAVVTNIQPDHLAILIGGKGACSIADGAGLLRNKDGVVNSDGDALSFDDIREQLRPLCKAPKGPLPCDSDSDFCYVSDVFPKYAIVEKSGKVYKVGYKVRKGKVSIEETEPEEVRKVTTYVTANGQVSVAHNEDQQGPVKSIPKLDAADISAPLTKRQQFDSVLKSKFSGIQQEGDWGGWTTDLFANYAIFSKDGKHFRLPYTYDDDRIIFGDDAQFEEVERISEYRRKNDTPIDGTASAGQALFSGNTNMATLPTLANAVAKKKIVIEGTPDQLSAIIASPMVVNAIHQGAHAAFHEPASAGTPHQEPAKSDTQVRTMAGGARAHEVNHMISGGHAKESERSMLMSLPDDHFESVKSFAMKGATIPIQPYGYEGIGDRSNAVHSSAHNAANLETWLKTAPPEVVSMVRNQQAAEGRIRNRCIQLVTNKNPKYNIKWLEAQSTDVLKGMAALAMDTPVQNRGGPDYSGQADAIPMFLTNTATQPDPNNPNAQVNNALEDDEILHLPSCG